MPTYIPGNLDTVDPLPRAPEPPPKPEPAPKVKRPTMDNFQQATYSDFTGKTGPK